jgi:hypothetical protein
MLLVYAVQILTSVHAKRNAKSPVSARRGAFSESTDEQGAMRPLTHESAAPAAESSTHTDYFQCQSFTVQGRLDQ